ncbi:acyl-CoA thioesterase [Geomonas sp. RF6]|uniref:acyl-CoA thioesterase n=1 Tax=Geomonas sp. RF6 TaxID=2897342 RepID=UPI001E30E7C1|nr:acyl-CoA thioesterase [Geomonas sp. RF6]UFS71482.1 acyl-CoA thioesterase [Geomonas sp. RF6]
MTTPIETSFYQILPLSTDLKLRRRFMVIDDPDLQGNLRFGLLLEILDKVAEETALKYVNRFHPEARVVTAAIDNILVRHAADVTKDLIFAARINHIGRSSLEVGIRVEQPGEPKNHVASCYFTMVARSGTGEGAVSVPLPPLEYQDELEKNRSAKALARRDEYRKHTAALLEPPTREEYEMFTALHKAQDEPAFQGLLAGRVATDSWERMVPEFENVPQKIFGGYLIRRAYELAAICSEIVAPDRPVVAAVNRINFYEPVRMGDKLHYTAKVVYTKGSFVCVEANIERISRDRTSRALSNSCLFTFVNVGDNLEHLPVPQVYPTTYAEDARYLTAHRSYTMLAEHYRII